MERFMKMKELLKTRGFFVAIEGGDGLGKTTICKGLEEILPFSISVIKFPSEDNNFGAMVRKMLNKEIPFDPWLMQSWQYGDKLIKQQMIKSLIEHGCLVIGDRYSASTLAYGLADHLPKEFCFRCIHELREPDLTIVLDGESFKGEGDVYEKRHHQVKIRNRYLYLAREYNWEIIEANRQEEVVLEDVLTLIENGIEKKEADPFFCRCIEDLCTCTHQTVNADKICDYCKDGLHTQPMGRIRDVMIKYGIIR